MLRIYKLISTNKTMVAGRSEGRFGQGNMRPGWGICGRGGGQGWRGARRAESEREWRGWPARRRRHGSARLLLCSTGAEERKKGGDWRRNGASGWDKARMTQGRASRGRYGQAQGDGEQALAARRAAMGARRELLKIFTPFDQNLTQI